MKDSADITDSNGSEKKQKMSGFIKPKNTMTVAAALKAFSSPSGETVKILRPPVVYSANAYSTPIAGPLGPAYLAALLETAGYDVDVIDGVGEGIRYIRESEDRKFKFQGLPPEEILKRIGPYTRILGVSMMFSQEWVHNRKLINQIKDAYPDILVIAGGEHPTSLPEYLLRDCPAIDYLITGEGELTLLELVWRHIKGEDTRSLPGLAYIDHKGRFVDNGLGRRIQDFANLPRPAWHLCQVENYFIGAWTHGIAYGRNMLILGTRGCPYQCTFCSNPFMWTTRYSMRRPKEVVDEIEWLIEEYDANSIDFADLTAIVKKNWILEYCAELKRRNLDIVWQLPSGTRSEALDTDTLQAIYEAGCRLLTYAPESGSEETLKIIKKRVKLNRLTESIRQALNIGHTVKINLIIGFPHEKRRHCWATILYAIKAAALGVHDCIISVFTPYPGSELYNELRQTDLIAKIDDQYFNDLILQFDFTVRRSFSPNVSGRELALYRILGMALFYLTFYAKRPTNFLRLLSTLWKKNFLPRSIIEQRVKDILVRMRMGTSTWDTLPEKH